jgi:hypothetical protein
MALHFAEVGDGDNGLQEVIDTFRKACDLMSEMLASHGRTHGDHVLTQCDYGLVRMIELLSGISVSASFTCAQMASTLLELANNDAPQDALPDGDSAIQQCQCPCGCSAAWTVTAIGRGIVICVNCINGIHIQSTPYPS